MNKIAFLGLGAMGSRMAARFVEAGYGVNVWNRSAGAGCPLEAKGAICHPSPAAAARNADLVFSMVRDDAASEAVWLGEAGALSAMRADAVGIECSTLSVPHVRRLAERFKAAGRAFLDAPLAGSRPQAEAGSLIFFVGGEADDLDRARPALGAMGSAVHHAGGHGAGATVKLMVNALFGAQLAMMAELIGLAERSGIDPARSVEIVGTTPVCSPAAKLASEAMLAGAFAPAFPIDLVAKDFDLAEASARAAGARVPVTKASGGAYREAVRQGYGEDNITGIMQLYAKGSDHA
ncbi:NAD(P)-dependent oxidoreductase [Parvularcula maris]|uniref:NAD(P)-dependent oxidoreductase n=1 Tax=Parvularcula maris TaxID=2965077 RepID=A0A9X2LDT2_9PROT|nr:NAD(P)-dependent oxidoreductase [Parvularcula maris]MCQ8186637.1 NAD(P)-dependent oxidoreductase [Parvularcula maris]